MIAQNHNHVASVGFINCTVQRHPLSLEPRFEGEKNLPYWENRGKKDGRNLRMSHRGKIPAEQSQGAFFCIEYYVTFTVQDFWLPTGRSLHIFHHWLQVRSLQWQISNNLPRSKPQICSVRNWLVGKVQQTAECFCWHLPKQNFKKTCISGLNLFGAKLQRNVNQSGTITGNRLLTCIGFMRW